MPGALFLVPMRVDDEENRKAHSQCRQPNQEGRILTGFDDGSK
jgi:hypothetical protein